MRGRFLQILETPGVHASRQAAYGRTRPTPPAGAAAGLTDEEIGFIRARDSFYIASISESGWPYIQHRGGPAGFLRVVDDRHLAFADFSGNRQLLTTGNIQHESRVCLFLMDYGARERLKILARASLCGADDERLAGLPLPDGGRVERGFVLEIEGYDWNCPKYITPRYTRSEIESVLNPLQERIHELENQLRTKNTA